jgi:hypothetical protein
MAAFTVPHAVRKSIEPSDGRQREFWLEGLDGEVSRVAP